jgi:hypothetical protein
MSATDRNMPSAAGDDMSDLPIGEQTRKERIFFEKFAWIQRQKLLGVTQKAIIDALQKRFGLKLAPARFNALYEAEEARHAKEGDQPRCPCCGAVLSSEAADQTGDSSSIGKATTNAVDVDSSAGDSKRVNS